MGNMENTYGDENERMERNLPLETDRRDDMYINHSKVVVCNVGQESRRRSSRQRARRGRGEDFRMSLNAQ